MIRRISVVLLLVCALACNSYVLAQNAELASKLKQHIQYLAGDELAGRYPGEDGNTKAADYIVSQFTKAGVQPLGSSYKQEFTIPMRVALAAGNSITFDVLVERPGVPKEAWRPVKRGWTVEKEYVPVGFSDSKTVSGPLAFAGFGLSNKDKGYDDYASLDAKGKVVVVLVGSPDSTYNPLKPIRVSQRELRMKATNAREHGAVGVIFIYPQGDSSNVLPALRFAGKNNLAGIVAVHAKRSDITTVFPKSLPIIGAEESIFKTKKPNSFDIPNTSATLSVALTVEEKTIANVLGVVPGTNSALANEYIVVGAHFDHLGMGDEHSLWEKKDSEKKIHYGADDNASGTAGMLELAALIAKNPCSRPVIFMGFNAEERGLLGSNHWVNNPTIPMDKVVFMLNMDMIGRLKDNKLNVQGVGTSSNFKTMIEELSKPYGFTIATTDDGMGPSDHASFYAKEKPVLFLFTGLHGDYHRPSDTPDKINYDGESNIVQFAESIARTVANNATKPDYIKVTPAHSDKQGTTAFKVVMGITPDYSDHPKGLKITGVRPGSPAEKAGLGDGDIIIKLGEFAIKNIYDYTYALAKFNPGDKVNVIVLRGPKEDKETTLPITFEARKE